MKYKKDILAELERTKRSYKEYRQAHARLISIFQQVFNENTFLKVALKKIQKSTCGGKGG